MCRKYKPELSFLHTDGAFYVVNMRYDRKNFKRGMPVRNMSIQVAINVAGPALRYVLLSET